MTLEFNRFIKSTIDIKFPELCGLCGFKKNEEALRKQVGSAFALRLSLLDEDTTVPPDILITLFMFYHQTLVSVGQVS